MYSCPTPLLSPAPASDAVLWHSVLQYGAVCFSVLHGVAVCSSVSQCVAVCCSVVQHHMPSLGFVDVAHTHAVCFCLVACVSDFVRVYLLSNLGHTDIVPGEGRIEGCLESKHHYLNSMCSARRTVRYAYMYVYV